MKFIKSIKSRAKKNMKRIVLPESMDKRVLEAARRATDEKLAHIILIGDIKKIEKVIKTDGIQIINPDGNEITKKLIKDLYTLRKDKGMTEAEAKKLLLNDYMYYACMLVHEGYADGVVSGACHSTANTLRPALQIIKTKPTSKLVSAFFVMVVPNCKYGLDGTFIFADSGLVQNPTAEELAYIAKDSADSFELLTRAKSVTAFLSHSTMGSASHEDVHKVVSAVEIAKRHYKGYLMDGELQADAAIVPEVAEMKAPKSKVAGHANVLVFPDLDAGNNGYKLVQRLAKAEAYGPITQGINKPINDLSRGCSTDDIVGTIAITAVQAE